MYYGKCILGRDQTTFHITQRHKSILFVQNIIWNDLPRHLGGAGSHWLFWLHLIVSDPFNTWVPVWHMNLTMEFKVYGPEVPDIFIALDTCGFKQLTTVDKKTHSYVLILKQNSSLPSPFFLMLNPWCPLWSMLKFSCLLSF